MKILAGVLVVVTILLSVMLGVKMYTFHVDCTGHLKRAADSNVKELAAKELKIALDYLEERSLTKGNSALIFHTPSNDMEFFYINLKAAHDELVNLSPDSTPLEKSNMLMKIRETILDDTTVTRPSNLSIYPNLFMWIIAFPLLWLGTILVCCVALCGY